VRTSKYASTEPDAPADYSAAGAALPRQIPIRVAIMRGGTSRGIFLLENDLPRDRSLWGPFLIALLGAGDVRQIDGLGGADPLTSKVCIVGAPRHEHSDVTYTFAQVGIGQSEVSWEINCGNLTAAVGAFAIEQSLVRALVPTTSVRIYQSNTRRLLTALVPVGPHGVEIEGETAIDGVPGTGAAIDLDFSDTAGATLDRGLLPTGKRIDKIDVDGFGSIPCTIMDLANMCVFFQAADVGLTGIEAPAQTEQIRNIFRAVQGQAQEILGIDNSRTTPWPIMVGPARDYHTLNRDLVPATAIDLTVRLVAGNTMHKAAPGTGACCTAVAAALPGTVVHGLASASKPGRGGVVRLGHPSGVMAIAASVTDHEDPTVTRAVFRRTARTILHGTAYLRRSRVEQLIRDIPLSSATRAMVPGFQR
jgi:2-methylaconitate cis-trans-isomerase PrpF